ncbi:hypothetical protein C8J56DRAFT_1064107 [Mycena floridula]|nr:hypothetical protein C8J56DRAFT_1064107 [Mycena floridula]
MPQQSTSSQKLELELLRETIEKQIRLKVQHIAGHKPFVHSIPSEQQGISDATLQHNYHAILCLGKGKDFTNIARWMKWCFKKAASGHFCNGFGGFITLEKLDPVQLLDLEKLWVKYEDTGKPWGESKLLESTRRRIVSGMVSMKESVTVTTHYPAGYQLSFIQPLNGVGTAIGMIHTFPCLKEQHPPVHHNSASVKVLQPASGVDNKPRNFIDLSHDIDESVFVDWEALIDEYGVIDVLDL